MTKKLPLFILLSTLLPAVSFCQFGVEPSNDIPVKYADGTALINPWTGGINSAQISTFDADQDGQQDDIFVFDRSGNRILVFLGEMQDGARVYHYDPVRSQQFPSLIKWALLRDFNCDGKKDIFTYSTEGGGISVYENTTTAGGELNFELHTGLMISTYEFSSSAFETNLYCSSLDIPAVFDFDGDGDLDIFTFGVGGSLFELHLNLSMEITGNCGVDTLRLANRCYGRFMEASEDNGILQDFEILSEVCDFNVVNPKSKGGSGAGSRHVGSTILAFDADEDDVADIVLGDVGNTNLAYLRVNQTEGELDSVDYVSMQFPYDFGAMPVDMNNFPAGFYEDIDGDGARDLTVGVNAATGAINKKSIWYYRNEGLDNAPDFNFIQNDFLQDETIDYGEAAAPALADVSGNGLKDLIIGSRGEFMGETIYLPRLSLYHNTGTSENPEFTLVDENWLDVDDLGFGQFIHPSFADLDGDGDLDLVIGDASGKVGLLTNTAGAGNPAEYELTGSLSADGVEINVGQNATPQLYDLDGDGLTDLIVGERNGNINYYRNIGSETNMELTFVTDTLGGVSTVELGFFIGSSAPHFYELEGETFLAAGTEPGRIHLFNNIDGNVDGDFNAMTTSAFGIDAGLLSKPAIDDLNGDGLLDIVCGSVGGGVQLSIGTTVVSARSEKPRLPLRIYPNPAFETITVSADGDFAGATYAIFNSAGQQVKRGSLAEPTLVVSDLTPGLYILNIYRTDRFGSAKFIKK
ncbi:MAG: T9SS type A sorting domain-containing protein [Cryomorphaceae bacterium]